MCGIAAIFGDVTVDGPVADAARDLMMHRGPDDEGSFHAPNVWLGSRRLAIIDVGPAGHMPFADDETGVVVVFNGEIYNYVELRAQLQSLGHRFRSRSDTEVLLRSYLEWGSGCPRRFNGMWSFAIWDPRERAGFVCRDRFGVKPLFMAELPGAFAVASEAKVLLALYPQLRRPDERSVVELLARKRVYATGSSFYESIEVFPTAHWATYRRGDGAPRLTRYWTVPPQEDDETMSWPEARDEFAVLFDDSVRLRLRSDVPLGVTLSGGLDSTAVVSSASRTLGPDATLAAYTSVYDATGGDDQDDESAWAEIAVASLPNTELRRAPAAQSDWLETLRRIVWHMDGPGFSPAVFPLWNLAAQVRSDGIKVLLEGQGADEILGGYSAHTAAALLDRTRAAIRDRDAESVRVLARSLRGAPELFSWRRVGGDLATQLVSGFGRWDRRRGTVFSALRPELQRLDELAAGPGRTTRDEPRRDRLTELLLDDFTRDLLPGFLHYGDAVTMAHSVENRLPFMDYRLVELGFRMPGAYKVRAGESKAPLRAYLQRSGQARIAQRRRKQGYPTPTDRWMAAEAGALLREILLDPGARVGDYIQPRRLVALIDRHASGAFAAGDSLFSLLCTELWLQQCVGGSAQPRRR